MTDKQISFRLHTSRVINEEEKAVGMQADCIYDDNSPSHVLAAVFFQVEMADDQLDVAHALFDKFVTDLVNVYGTCDSGLHKGAH